MPEISRGHGIRICMYFEDHPPPHFRAIGGGFRVVIEIATQDVNRGSAPRSELARIKKWAAANQAGMQMNWQNLQTGVNPVRLPSI